MDIVSLIKQADDDSISFEDFAAYAHEGDIISLVNEFSLEVAKRFIKKEMDFDVCDGAMNYLFALMTDDIFLNLTNNVIPSPALEIYDAFDAGEYFHKGDSRDIDPSEKYMVPLISEILSNAST